MNVGAIGLIMLSEALAERINYKRRVVRASVADTRFGDNAKLGDYLPLIVTKTFADGTVNGHVLADGDISLFVDYVKMGSGAGQFLPT